MSEFYVFWRAHLQEGGAGSTAHLLRAVDELAAYPSVVAPIYDNGSDPRAGADEPSGEVGFGFAVYGFDSPLDAHDWAESALRNSLHSVRIGTPGTPDGGVPHVRLLLEDNPTVRLIAADSWLTSPVPRVA